MFHGSFHQQLVHITSLAVTFFERFQRDISEHTVNTASDKTASVNRI